MLKQSRENLVLQAVMDEYEENREKNNITAEILNKEKVSSYYNNGCLLIGMTNYAGPSHRGYQAVKQTLKL